MKYPDTKSKKWILQFFLLAFFSNNLFSQNLPHKIYTINDGLAGMQCFNVFKDSRGYIWTITSNGLSRFDGEYFTNFNTENGLENNLRFSNLIETSDSKICFLNGKYLNFYDNKIFTKYLLPDFYHFQHNLFLYNYNVDEVLFFLSKTLEFEKHDAYIFNSKTKKYTKLIFPKFKQPNQTFSPFYFDQKSNSFIGFMYHDNIKKGVFILKNGNYELVLKSDLDDEYGTFLSNTERLFVDIKDKNSGYVSYLFSNGKFIPRFYSNINESKVIKEINQDAIFERNGSVYLIEKGTKSLRLISDRVGLASNYILDEKTKLHGLLQKRGCFLILIMGFNISLKETQAMFGP